MDVMATAIIQDGKRVDGRLTTAHAACLRGQPVFVGKGGYVLDWQSIADIEINHAAELGRKGGMVSSPAKAKAARENGKKGGRPRRNSNDR